MLCALWRRWRGNTRAEIGAWIASSFALGGWAVGAPEILTVPFAFATLLLALALGAERAHHPLSGRFIHWLGEISYATYLSHFLLFFAFKLAFVSDARNVSPALICLFLLIVLGTSALLYYGVERTAQRTILRGWAARQRPIFNPVRST
jgi:peptidoglycan/LPS O-acetylase OafA/YrhL